MPTTDDVLARAQRFLAEDPDADTRTELQDLLEANDLVGLHDRFDRELEFGTAGLRGTLGAGTNRMNRVVVQRAAAGLVAYLNERVPPGAGVVIGYDARHKSDVFAADTAAIVAGAGLTPLMFGSPVPTPLVAFAIRHLDAVAGVVVTASHNPPADNGYKVYLGDGSQIVPPADADISAAIASVGTLAEIPRAEPPTRPIDADVTRAYLDHISTLIDRVGETTSPQRRALRIVSTPLHGVGGALLDQALRTAGFAAPDVVPAQAEPDPDFPTVAFPNPEEQGAIDLALARAEETGADLVIANDPDADRCALAIRTAAGPWRMLTGDEVGVLLGRRLLRLAGDGDVVAASIVSSRMLGRLAAARGVRYVETLTGFKWIGRVPGLLFGYEEALGYCVDPAAVADKDGISAAVVAADITAAAIAGGRGVQDELDEGAMEAGVHATGQVSVRYDDPEALSATMRALRAKPPAALAGRKVERTDDLAQGSSDLPPTDGLRFSLSGDARVTIRPSGTEPKVKAYLEVVEAAPADRADLPAARGRADAALDALRTAVSSLIG